MSKMYILVKDGLVDEPGKVAVSVAHGALACYLKYKDSPEVAEWLSGPFYKVVCTVSNDEFEKAKTLAEDYVVVTESTMGDLEVALAFKPREEWPKAFKFYKLYR